MNSINISWNIADLRFHWALTYLQSHICSPSVKSSDISLHTTSEFTHYDQPKQTLCVQLHQHVFNKNLHFLQKSQCGDCVLAPGDSDLSSFIPVSSGVEEIEVGSTELFVSKEDEADEGRDTTMYFCRGREAVSPAPLPDSSLTRGCKVEVALGTVLVTGEADWEELMVITWWECKYIKD